MTSVKATPVFPEIVISRHLRAAVKMHYKLFSSTTVMGYLAIVTLGYYKRDTQSILLYEAICKIH
ncbi:hypothetical protein L873DRAFT_1803795 [Choiromyces venosus 120613-1]|uniref:Uncharacterized protein n=1 Tax=Choiromyces venosus 120613-1 TaxID=1336337 RepID=A0A3N4JYU1_9PEZI|nr:hypothetical protein L873DRAFT_1803795 [Choiromyces venosus 120613-1]